MMDHAGGDSAHGLRAIMDSPCPCREDARQHPGLRRGRDTQQESSGVGFWADARRGSSGNH